MSEKYKDTGLRAAGEGDRSPAFKQNRDKLVGTVNTFLLTLIAKRDAGEALPDGTTILNQPRVIRTLLGKTAMGVNAMAEERRYGLSLSGDGETSPLVMQAVRKSGEGSTTIEITGSDPLARAYANDGYSLTAQQEIVASFSMTDTAPDQPDRYFGYEVMGDGSVKRKYIDGETNVSISLREGNDIQIALEAFSHVQEHLS